MLLAVSGKLIQAYLLCIYTGSSKVNVNHSKWNVKDRCFTAGHRVFVSWISCMLYYTNLTLSVTHPHISRPLLDQPDHYSNFDLKK